MPADSCAAAAALQEVHQEIAGEAIDLYYDKKELFIRGWTHKEQQSWNLKAKRQTHTQVEKRRLQKARGKGEFDEDDSGGGGPCTLRGSPPTP